MKFLTKISAGFLLSFGFLCLMMTFSKVSDLGDTNLDSLQQQEARSEAFLGAGFSLPMLVTGGWMLWGLEKKRQKQTQDKLQSSFYKQLKAERGKITILGFAMETHLSAKEAKQYLDQKAQEFNAAYEISDNGDVSYCFHLLANSDKHKNRKRLKG
jgi:hypothetical protein